MNFPFPKCSNSYFGLDIHGEITLFLNVGDFACCIEQTATYSQQNDCVNAETIAIAAISGLKYNVTDVSVHKGSCVHFIFENKDTQFHDLVIDSFSGFGGVDLDAEAGETSEARVQMPNATMTLEFYCSVPGHRDGGMKASCDSLSL